MFFLCYIFIRSVNNFKVLKVTFLGAIYILACPLLTQSVKCFFCRLSMRLFVCLSASSFVNSSILVLVCPYCLVLLLANYFFLEKTRWKYSRSFLFFVVRISGLKKCFVSSRLIHEVNDLPKIWLNTSLRCIFCNLNEKKINDFPKICFILPFISPF